MKEMQRVSAPIPFLTKDFKVEGVYSGSVLPYFTEQPGKTQDGILFVTRYYLTVIDGRLFYLHEDAKSVPITA